MDVSIRYVISKAVIFSCILLYLFKTIPVQSQSVPLPYSQPGNWNLEFSEEFNGTQLDLSKWQPNWLASNNTDISKPVNSLEESCYDPSQVRVNEGLLILTAVRKTCLANNGRVYEYASGLINSQPHFTFSYGYFETRFWLDGQSAIANWPAFWADGTGTWPTTGEIDVFEGLNGRASWHYHWGTPTNPQSDGGYPVLNTQTGWHIFAADWKPGSITFYYDGIYAGQTASNIAGGPMFLILNYGISASVSPPITVPSSVYVDYVRVWKSADDPTPSPSMATKPGDANGDNLVDGRDYVVWMSHYNQTISGVSNGDFDNNSIVDGRDYVVWMTNYGR